MPLFEIAVLERAKVAKDDEEQELDVLIVPPTAIVAVDDESAALGFVMDNAEKLKDVNRSRMQVLVRPFE